MAHKASSQSATSHEPPVHFIMMYSRKAFHRQSGQGEYPSPKSAASCMVRNDQPPSRLHHSAYLPKHSPDNIGLVFMQSKTYGDHIKGGPFEPCLGSVPPYISNAVRRLGHGTAQHGGGTIQACHAQIRSACPRYVRPASLCQKTTQRPCSAAHIQHPAYRPPVPGFQPFMHCSANRPVHRAQQRPHDPVVRPGNARVCIGFRHGLLREFSPFPTTANVG